MDHRGALPTTAPTSMNVETPGVEVCDTLCDAYPEPTRPLFPTLMTSIEGLLGGGVVEV
jgi:hypothetical protein